MTDAKSKIDYLIEVSGVYDGWSIAVVREPQYGYVNRWSTDEDPTVPEPGYETRFHATEEYIGRSNIPRIARSQVEGLTRS